MTKGTPGHEVELFDWRHNQYNGTMGLNILSNIGRLGSCVELQRMDGNNHKGAMVI